MDVYDVIVQRRTVHHYAPRAVPEAVLRRALLAAIRAPNHGVTEPWRFDRVGPRTRAALLAIGLDLATHGGRKPLPASALALLETTVHNPPELLIVSQLLDADLETRQEDYAAVACAIQNLSLVLWAEGIGTKWLTTDVTTDPRTYAQLAIDSERQRIVGFIWIGYPVRGEAPLAPRRKGLDQVLRTLP